MSWKDSVSELKWIYFIFNYIFKVNFIQTGMIKKYVSTNISTSTRMDLLFFQIENITLLNTR